MRKILLLMVVVLVASCGSKDSDIQAIKELTKRVVPDYSYKFIFEKEKSDKDFFRLEQRGTRVLIVGNNANSMAMGLNHYLKNYVKDAVSVPTDAHLMQ